MKNQVDYSWIKKLGLKHFFDFPMASLTTFQIGGPADLLVAPGNKDELASVIKGIKKHSSPYCVLGSGSNLLVVDEGFRGIVVYLGSAFELEPEILNQDDQSVLIRVFCNQSKAILALWAAQNQYSGLEFSAGIPGTMGGAVYMNAGTKWGSYAEVIEEVEFFHADKGFYKKKNSELGFKYRGHGEGLFSDGSVVVSIDLRLKKKKDSAEIVKLMDEILAYRGERQPLELPNCGSVFKNPENSEKGAGRLIEACGLKGTRVGNAQISEKHANFILNLGSAKASDVICLMSFVQNKVLEKFQIKLEPELLVI